MASVCHERKEVSARARRDAPDLAAMFLDQPDEVEIPDDGRRDAVDAGQSYILR